MKPRTTTAGAVAVALLLALAVPASANHTGNLQDHAGPPSEKGVEPFVVEGNPTCADLGDVDGGYTFEDEFKLEPVADGTYTDPETGFTVTIDVHSSPFPGLSGNVFDYEITSDHVADAVFVKGGNIGGNLYNNEAQVGALSSDGNLHSPLQRRNITQFGGLSHISFCFSEAPAELEIEKTPDGGTVAPGDDATFTLTVTNVGSGTATNVVIDDELPAGFTWTEDPDLAECDITDGTTLHCDVGNLAPDASFSVTVSAPTTRDDCGLIDNPAAKADADNAEEVSDAGDITVECGAIKIVKTAKHADTTGETSPDLGATFDIKQNDTVVETVSTDSETGEVCVDGLAFGDYSVDEVSGADGYALDEDVEAVTVDNAAACDDDPFAGETVEFENIPLTDITWRVDSQHDGATETVVDCKDSEGTSLPGYPMTVSDGTDTLENLIPTDPDVTVTCAFTVDP